MKTSIYSTLIILFCCRAPLSVNVADQDSKKDLYKIFSSMTVRVEVPKKQSRSTGIILKINDNENYRMLLTNRHAIEDADTLELVISQIDGDFNIIDTLRLKIAMFNPKGDSLFHFPRTKFDIACTLIPISSFLRNERKVVISSIDTSFFVPQEKIREGLDVLFLGYPQALWSNLNSPFVRSGMISAIDTLNQFVYLEANVFGGSSGSPVFLDFRNPLNFDPTHLRKVFVGIIAKTFISPLNVRSGITYKSSDSLVENANLAIIMPAKEIRDLYEESVKKLSKYFQQ